MNYTSPPSPGFYIFPWLFACLSVDPYECESAHKLISINSRIMLAPEVYVLGNCNDHITYFKAIQYLIVILMSNHILDAFI